MFYWSRFPFVRVVLFFALGILLAIYLPQISTYVQITAAIALIIFVALLAYKRSWMLALNFSYGLSLSCIFLALGFFATTQANESRKPNHLIHYETASHYTGRIISQSQVKGDYLRMKIEVSAIKHGDWQTASGKVLAYFKIPSDHLPVYGDKLLVEGFPSKVSPPLNPKEFDYRQFLAFNQVYHQDFINENQWLLLSPASGLSIIRWSIFARNYLAAKLAMFIPDNAELAIAKALILGDKADLDNPTKEVYAQAGAMHVLAVSGLHVGVIYLVLLSLLGQRNGRVTKPILVAIIVIPSLWAYAFITGLSPSVLRAVTMFSFLAMAQVFNRRSATFNTLAISALILLIVNPYMIMSVGFQLSYVAVIGIIFLYPIFENWFYPTSRIGRFFWQITALSLAAQLATSPLSALYFHRFPTYFLFSNLLVIPAAMLIVWGGLALLILGSISSTLGIMLGKVLGLLIWLVNQSLLWLAKLPYADIHNLAPTILDTWMLYGLILFAFLFISLKRWAYYKFAALTVLLLSINFLYADIRTNSFRQIVFYSVNNSWAIDLVEDKNYLPLADSLLLTNKRKIDFLLNPYRRFHGLAPVNSDINKTSVANLGEVIVWHGKSILLANPCLEEREIPKDFDFVLYKTSQSGMKCYQEQILLRKFVNNQEVKYTRHNLHTQGAIIIDI